LETPRGLKSRPTARIWRNCAEETGMTRFLQGAADLLDAAANGVRAGYTPSDTVILIGADRSVRVICDSDWSLDSLRLLHGTCTAYRVSSVEGVIRVEGRDTGHHRAALMLLGAPAGLRPQPKALQAPVDELHGKADYIEVTAVDA
jgi:hypothetical protein